MLLSGGPCSAARAARRGAPACTHGPRPFCGARASRRRCTRVLAVSYDPENLFKGSAPRQGLIERRMMQQQLSTDKEFAAAVAAAADEDRKKVLLRRQSRNPPKDHVELIEYFLNTQADDMEYEVARCRPLLSPEFFKQLDTIIGQERFAPGGPDEERLAELDLLRDYLTSASAAVDAAVAANVSAVARMKELLSAKDKKAKILAMAEANEIDAALLDLLQSNADAARTAGQEDAAAFMEKVRTAAAKFAVSAAPSSSSSVPAPPARASSSPAGGAAAAAGGGGGGGSGLIVPGGGGGGANGSSGLILP